MKALRVAIISSIALVTIFIVLKLFLSGLLLQSPKCPPFIRLLLQLFIAPKDYYEYLINDPLNLTEKGLTKRFKFKNKYIGGYSAGILLDNFSDHSYFKSMSEKYKLKLKMEVNFYQNGNLILSRIVENKYFPFLSLKGSGFAFIIYKSPDDLPSDKLLVCEVKIIESDTELENTYGPVRFYIRKDSDM